MALARTLEFFREAPSDLVENEPDERLRSIDVRWGYDEIEAYRFVRTDQIGDVPVTSAGHCGNDRIPIEPQK